MADMVMDSYIKWPMFSLELHIFQSSEPQLRSFLVSIRGINGWCVRRNRVFSTLSGYKWRFPEIGLLPNHSFVDVSFSIKKPSSYWGSHWWKAPNRKSPADQQGLLWLWTIKDRYMRHLCLAASPSDPADLSDSKKTTLNTPFYHDIILYI